MTQHEDHIAKELFKIYKISLVNYCIRKYKSSREDSEEFVSETFLRLTEKIEQVAYRSPAEQRSWLFSTLTHIVSEHYRKNKYISKKGFESYEAFIHDNDKDEYEQILEDDTYDKLISDIKSKLKDKEKLYFEKFIQGEYNYKEIAKSENINYNTFKSTMLRLSPKIRKIALQVLKEHELLTSNLDDSNIKQ